MKKSRKKRRDSVGFFGVIVRGNTYSNLLYLLLSFPLGIFYFVLVITGLSLGLGLVFTLLGIPILFGTLLLCRVFANFELQQAKILSGISRISHRIKKSKGFWNKIKAYLADSYTWKSLAYLIIKFPIGIINFVLLVTLLSVSLSLIATPVVYHLFETGIIFQGTFCSGPESVCFIFDSYLSTIIVGIIGIFLLFVFLHALNGLARTSGLLAKSMLEKRRR